MGMFDTVVFPEPISCARFGAAIPSTQTHELGEMLETYRVGDVAEAADVATGIVRERLYCQACRTFDQPIYLTLWHGLITGVYADEAEAERNLLAVDRADILHYLAQHQREE